MSTEAHSPPQREARGGEDVPHPPPSRPRPQAFRLNVPKLVDLPRPEALVGVSERLAKVSEKIKALMREAQRECSAGTAETVANTSSALSCLKSMRSNLGVVSKSLRERDAAFRSLRQYNMGAKSSPSPGSHTRKRSEAELGVIANILKASVRALESFAFDCMQNSTQDHEASSDPEPAREWQARVAATERKFANRAIDEDLLADAIEEKNRLMWDIMRSVTKQRKALAIDPPETGALDESFTVGLIPSALETGAASRPPLVSPSGDTTDFIQMTKDVLGLMDLLASLKVSRQSRDEADAVTKLRGKIDLLQDNLRKSDISRSRLQAALDRISGVKERDGLITAQKELAFKQRARIEELDAELRSTRYRNSEVEVEVARLQRESAVEKDALLSLRHDLDEARAIHAEHVESYASRVDQLQSEGLKLHEVVNQITVNLDLVGVLVQRYMEQGQGTKRGGKTDELEAKVKKLEASLSECQAKVKEKERLAILAMASRRQAVDQYREVKKALEECQSKAAVLEQTSTKERQELEQTSTKQRQELLSTLNSMETRHDGQLTELHVQVAKNVEEISRLQALLDTSSEPMARAEQLRFELLRTQALARELEAKNKDYQGELEFLHESLLHGEARPIKLGGVENEAEAS